MHAAQLKSKKHPHAGKLKHVRIEMADNGGATVHTMHHPATMHEYPNEVQAGAYGSKEEALHAAGKHMGVNMDMSDEDGASDEPGGAVMSKK